MSKSEDLYREFRVRIIRGEWVGGYRLVIDSLAREYGVSAIPVREAIRRLEAENLVDFYPNVGARVAHIGPETYSEVFTVKARLEGWAAALSVPVLTGDDIERLRTMVHTMDKVISAANFARYSVLNREFHEALNKRCPNRFLLMQIAACSEQLGRMQTNIFSLVPERAIASLEDHYHIVQSLSEGAPPEVLERFVTQHQLKTLHCYRAYMEQHGPHNIEVGGRV